MVKKMIISCALISPTSSQRSDILDNEMSRIIEEVKVEVLKYSLQFFFVIAVLKKCHVSETLLQGYVSRAWQVAEKMVKVRMCQNRNKMNVSFHIRTIIDNHIWRPGRLIDLPVRASTQRFLRRSSESVNQLHIRQPSSSNQEADQGTQPWSCAAVRKCISLLRGATSDTETGSYSW